MDYMKRANGDLRIYLYYAGGWQQIYFESTIDDRGGSFFYQRSFDSINYTNAGHDIYYMYATITPTGNYWNRSSITGVPAEAAYGSYYSEIYPQFYSVTLGNNSVLQSGTLNWIAVGR